MEQDFCIGIKGGREVSHGDGHQWIKGASPIGLPCVECCKPAVGAVDYGSRSRPALNVFCADHLEEEAWTVQVESHHGAFMAERE